MDNIQHKAISYIDVVLSSGFSNMCYFTLAFLFYLLVGQIFGRQFISSIESKKSSIRLIVEVITNTWIAGIMATTAHWIYDLLPFVSLHNIPSGTLRDAGISGLFMTYFMAFDVKLKGQLSILSERVQKINTRFIVDFVRKTKNKLESFDSNHREIDEHDKNASVLY